MTPNITKVYTPLSQIKTAKIEKCSALLPNAMQCWRAGDVQVIRQIVTPAYKDEAKKDHPEITEKQEYQLCYRHAQIEQQQAAIDAAAHEASMLPETTKEAEKPQVETKTAVPAAATATPTTVVTKKPA